MAAIAALGDMGIDAENAVGDLFALTKDSDKYVGSAAMFALGQIAHGGVDEARVALESQLQSPISATRSLAANVFWQRGVPVKNAVPVLLKLLNDDLAETRYGAARSLGSLRPPTSDVIDSLRIVLKKDSDGSVRSAAASSLANFGAPAKGAIPEMREALKDFDPEVRRVAAQGVGQLRAADAETLKLITALLKDNSEPVRQQAAWTLVNLGQTPPDAVTALIELLQDPATEIRRGAAVALRRASTGANAAVPNLILLLKDPNEQVRLDAIGTFGNFGPMGTDAVPRLSEIVIDERERINIRTAAADSLAKIGPGAKAALPSLQIAMRSENDQVRSESVKAFAQVGAPSEILPVLTKDLKSRDVFTRLTALQGLSAMGLHAKDAVPNLTECLKDEENR
jgi:HEAT repeat protein